MNPKQSFKTISSAVRFQERQSDFCEANIPDDRVLIAVLESDMEIELSAKLVALVRDNYWSPEGDILNQKFNRIPF